MTDKMTNIVLTVLLSVKSLSVTAAEKDVQKNYCLDPVDNKEFGYLLSKHPTDTGIIRLFAMRQGLCEMIGKPQISPIILKGIKGKMWNHRTPMDTLLDGKQIWTQKNLNQI